MQNLTRHEYLTAVHASLICIFLSHTIYNPLFFSIFCLSLYPSFVRFQEFPLGVARVLMPKQIAVLSVFAVRISLSLHHRSFYVLKNIGDKNIPQKSTGRPWSHRISFTLITMKRAPEGWLFDPPTHPSSLIMTFELSVDHETLSSCLLPREMQETGSCDPVVYAGMEKPINAVTWQVTGTHGSMWALFSNKFLLPWGPWWFHKTCLKCHKMQDRFIF